MSSKPAVAVDARDIARMVGDVHGQLVDCRLDELRPQRRQRLSRQQ